MTLRYSLRKSLRTFLRLLCHPLCRHTETLTKTAGTRAYTECLRCEYQSKGVVIAGHDYASTKHSWELAPRVAKVVAQEGSKFFGGGGPSVLLTLPPVAIAPDKLCTTCGKPPVCGCPVAIAPEPATPVLGNLAGHATAVRRKTLGNKDWDDKENWLPQTKEELAVRNILRDVVNDRASIHEVCKKLSCKPTAKTTRKARKPRKISVKSVRKTARKPSSKRSKTA